MNTLKGMISMDINKIKNNVMEMADKISGILALIEKGFMEHRVDILNSAIKMEHNVNDQEKTLTRDILVLSKQAKGNLTELSSMAQIVETLERMGDEAADLIERIEIKITEKLMFSEEGVGQFNETYSAMQESVNMMREFLRDKSPEIKKKILDNGFHVKFLVERYRKEHADRLVKGTCTPMGANMYFDMLDFTGNLARHASSIVKLF
jgi:phosphate:Na+ symporter